MTDDELIEAMALKLHPAAFDETYGDNENYPDERRSQRNNARRMARAALAVAEPVIRERAIKSTFEQRARDMEEAIASERERCALVAMATDTDVPLDQQLPDYGVGYEDAKYDIAAAIREGARNGER